MLDYTGAFDHGESLFMRLAILLFCSVFLFGQTGSPPPQPKAEHGRQVGNVEILSDTHGVDLSLYVKTVLQKVKGNWHNSIPESSQWQKGNLAIEFAIKRDGQIAGMKLLTTSGYTSLDRAAWGGITLSTPLPPLPSEFVGQYLALRFRFYYNPDKNDLADGSQTVASTVAPSPSQTRVEVKISPVGGREVPVGGSKMVVATVTGTKEDSVVWNVTGSGCSESACGKMAQDSSLYIAPSLLPSPPFVTLTAVSKADPTAKASVTFHIVQPSSSN
ncbi:MAG: TonB C-terminal domain-containing protein [Candidatus Sulfotelmatobacter sp.]